MSPIDDEPYNASVPLAKHNFVPTRLVIIMFELLSFFANIVTDPVSILSPPLLSFPFRRLPESVAFTICICEHKKG